MTEQDQNQKHLMNEDDPALKNLERVERMPQRAGAPGAPPDVLDRYQSGVVSGLGLQPDIVASQLPGKSPVFRLMPVSIAGNPQTNAAIQSTSVIAGGGGGSIELKIPSIFTPEDQTVNLPGPLEFDLAPEPAHTALMGPTFVPPIPAVPAFDKSASATSTVTVPAFSVGPVTPTFSNEFAIALITPSPASTPSGWTVFGAGSNTSYFQNVTTPTVTFAGTFSGLQAYASILVTFGSNGTLPVVLNDDTNSFSVTSPVSVPSTNPTTAGNVLIGLVQMLGAIDFVPPTLSDSQGNTWVLLAAASESTANRFALIYAAGPIVGGANTVTITKPGGFASSGTLEVVEVSNLSGGGAASAIPTFRLIDPSDLPTIPIGGGGVSGILPVANGGTGSDLSATGGASEVLKQSTVGGNVTVGTLAASDLSNGVTGTGAVVLAGSPTVTTPKWTAFTVAALPAGAEGQYAYASNGRKVGEGVGTGTGVPVYFSNALWRVFSTDAQVLA